MTETPMILGLRLMVDRDGDYFHLVFRPSLRLANGTTESTPYGAETTWKGKFDLTSLVIICQGNNKDSARKLYGFECRYSQLYAVNLREAERMAKTLRAIDKGLDKIGAARGYVRTFGEYVARVGEILGATEVLVQDEHRSGGWRTLHSIGEGRNYVENLEYQWARENQREGAEA